jgi:phage recombination protein Bet
MMPTGTEIVEAGKVPLDFSREQLDLMKKTVAKGVTDQEFDLFREVCRMRGLNPFANQIYAIKRKTKKGDPDAQMTIQVGIDGFRLQAQRSREYEGQTKPEWCDANGRWHEVWLNSKAKPIAARVGVYRKNFREALYAVVHFSEYAQEYHDTFSNTYKLQGMWAKMPANQISKCAEAAALRKAFPEELSGFYVPEEMPQADGDDAPNTTERTVRGTENQPAAVRPSEQSDSPFKLMLQYFEAMKPMIGETAYYEILRSFGYDHSNEIRNIEDGRKVYEAMKQRLRGVDQQAQAAQTEETTKEDREDW